MLKYKARNIFDFFQVTKIKEWGRSNKGKTTNPYYSRPHD
jgi:hypothetical protein